MLSFVVQNYDSQPILAKTRRYVSWVLLNSLNIKWVLLKHNIYQTSNVHFSLKNQLKIWLTEQFHIITYWSHLIKKLSYSHDTVVCVNSTKGYYFLLYRSFSQIFCKNLENFRGQTVLNNYVYRELKAYQVLEFPFHKKVYDTFIFFIIFVLTTNYLSFKNDFTLKYNFILKPDNFNILVFLNKFYFQTYNY